MTLRKRIGRLEATSPGNPVTVAVPKKLVERLAQALTDNSEDRDIRDVFDAWEVERGQL